MFFCYIHAIGTLSSDMLHGVSCNLASFDLVLLVSSDLEPKEEVNFQRTSQSISVCTFIIGFFLCLISYFYYASFHSVCDWCVCVCLFVLIYSVNCCNCLCSNVVSWFCLCGFIFCSFFSHFFQIDWMNSRMWLKDFFKDFMWV